MKNDTSLNRRFGESSKPVMNSLRIKRNLEDEAKQASLLTDCVGLYYNLVRAEKLKLGGSKCRVYQS